MAEQNAVTRTTEGPRDSGAVSKGKGATTGKRGRPAGSTNKPKSLVPKDIADTMLLAMRDQLPPEHYEYVKGVVKDGKAVSTKTELQTLILLLSRNLWAALVDEMNPAPEPENLDDAIELIKDTGTTAPKQVFRRDVTERLKVLNSLLSLLNQIEKRDEDRKVDGENPLIKIWAARGMQARVAVVINTLPELPAGEVIEGTATEV